MTFGRSKPGRAARYTRFLVGGGLNTAATYGLYLLLFRLIGCQPAYFLAYVFGIFFSYAFNCRFVFHSAMSWKSLFAYPLVYLTQYALSALLLWVLVDRFGGSATYAPLAVTACMLPLTYVMSRTILVRFQNNSK